MPLVISRKRGEVIEYVVPANHQETRIRVIVTAVLAKKVKLLSECSEDVLIYRPEFGQREPNDEALGSREEREEREERE